MVEVLSMVMTGSLAGGLVLVVWQWWGMPAAPWRPVIQCTAQSPRRISQTCSRCPRWASGAVSRPLVWTASRLNIV